MIHGSLVVLEQSVLFSWNPQIQPPWLAVVMTVLIVRCLIQTRYSTFWIYSSKGVNSLKKKKKKGKESNSVSTSKEKDLNIKRFKKALGKIGEALEYFLNDLFAITLWKPMLKWRILSEKLHQKTLTT